MLIFLFSVGFSRMKIQFESIDNFCAFWNKNKDILDSYIFLFCPFD